MIADKLYEYQEQVIDPLVSRRRQGLFDEPGAGKTVTILGALERDGTFERPTRTLILATKTGAALTWMRECGVLPEDVVVVPAHSGPIAGRRRAVGNAVTLDRPVVVVANHAFIETANKTAPPEPMWQVVWDAVIIDESHKVLPTKAAYTDQYTQFWKGLTHLQTHRLTLLYAMSGTPDRGKLENRYGTWKFLLPEAYNSTLPYETWVRKNFHVKYKRIAVRRRGSVEYIEQMIPDGLRDPEAWNAMESVMTIRRTKAEIAPWLPPKRYIPVMLPIPLALKKKYVAFLTEAAKQSGDDEGTQKMLWMHSQMFAAGEVDIKIKPDGTRKANMVVGGISPKRDFIIEWLQERSFDAPEEGTARRKVVIASQWSVILRWLHEELAHAGFESVVMDGGLSTKQRVTAQERFQRGDLSIILLNMSLGDSIDLDAADDMIMVTETHDPDVKIQTEDRVHRVSRNHNVFVWQLRSIGTIDEIVAAVSEGRYHETRQVYEGRRGIDFAKMVLARLNLNKE